MGCDRKHGNVECSPKECFSILERIEWAATLNPAYLQDVAEVFQYPRTDRMGCDLSVVADYVQSLTGFSILERIEWAATATSQ